MTAVYLFLTHLGILASILFMGTLTVKMIRDSADREERFLRSLAVATGFLLFLGAKATVQNVSDLLVAGLEVLKPLQIPLLGNILPMGAGALAAWFLVFSIERDPGGSRFIYLLLMLGTFLLVLFSDVYATSWTEPKAGGYNEELRANLSFVLGLLLYVLFGRKLGTIKAAAKPKSWREHL